MLSRLPRILVALTLAGSIGLHWTFLQMVAWTGMVVTYSQDAPLSEAMAKTFDGKHPCCLCKEIAKAKSSERKTEFNLKVTKLECPRVSEALVLYPPTAFVELRTRDQSAKLLTHGPPTPPPRILPG